LVIGIWQFVKTSKPNEKYRFDGMLNTEY